MKIFDVKSMFRKTRILITFMLFVFVVNSVNAQVTTNSNAGNSGFVHPGVYHKKSDLDRMKYMVEAGIEPYKTSFDNFAKVWHSSYDYSIRKDPNDDTLARENPSHQRFQFEDDVQAARHNAIMWYITGDERHAEKAIEILNAWSSLKSFYGGGTEPLSAGLYATPLVDAAEIMKHTYDGWAAEDIQKFGDMLVYPGYSNTVIPEDAIKASGADEADGVTFYWSVYQGDPGRAGNQGLLAWRSVMAIGIFLDNEIIYERGLRQVQGMGHRSDDFSYASGPAILNGGADRDFTNYVEAFDENDTIYTVLDDRGIVNEATVHFVDWVSGGRGTTIEDWGYDDQIQHYIWENGQCEESSRDQGHSSLGLGAVADIAEIAWNQGDDVYSYMDNRLLMGLEYTAKYNLSIVQSYPDQPEPWEPTVENGEYIRRSNRTGRREALAPNPWIAANQERNSRGEAPVTRPVYEMQTAHYNVRMGMEDEALWLNRSKEKAIELRGTYEDGEGTDAPGWGGLVFHRPEDCAGDPVSNVIDNTPTFSIPVLPALQEKLIIIEAENYDYFSGNAEGRTYHETSENNTGNVYRVDETTTERTAEDYINEGVDIIECSEGGYNLSEIENGEWLTYTVYVPVKGKYNFTIRYASANSNGKIKLNIGGTDLTEDVTVPFGGDNSTGLTDWKDFSIASVDLTKGVQNIRVLFNGESNAFELNNFKISLDSYECQEPSDEANFVKGVRYEYYEGDWDELPNFDLLEPKDIGVSDNIDFLGASKTNYFGMVYDAYINIEEDGDYTFYLTSDEGSKLSINGIEIIDNDGLHTSEEKSATICLKAGAHQINVQYFDNIDDQELLIEYEGPSITRREIENYYNTPHNLALRLLGGYATHIETRFDGFARYANDGNTDGTFGNESVSHTINGSDGDFSEKWWQVELKEESTVVEIKIYNRTDSNIERLNNFTVELLDENEKQIESYFFEDYPDPSISIDVDNIKTKIVKISKNSDGGIALAEVEVYGGDIVDFSDPYYSLTLKDEVEMAPNPIDATNGYKLNIYNSENTIIQVYNSVGLLVLEKESTDDQYSLDMSTLSRGIYIIKVTGGNSSKTQKIIKN